MIHTKTTNQKTKTFEYFQFDWTSSISTPRAITSAYKDMQANDKSLWAPHASTSKPARDILSDR